MDTPTVTMAGVDVHTCAWEPLGLPEEAADAWAAVLIDIYEKEFVSQEVEHGECRTAG